MKRGEIARKKRETIALVTKFKPNPNYEQQYTHVLKEGLKQANSPEGLRGDFAYYAHHPVTVATKLGRHGLTLRMVEKGLGV